MLGCRFICQKFRLRTGSQFPKSVTGNCPNTFVSGHRFYSGEHSYNKPHRLNGHRINAEAFLIKVEFHTFRDVYLKSQLCNKPSH